MGPAKIGQLRGVRFYYKTYRRPPKGGGLKKVILGLALCGHFNTGGQPNPSNAETTFIQSTKTQKKIENHLHPVLLVCIGLLSLGSLR